MGFPMPDDLKKLIPILKKNISLAKSILVKDPENEDLRTLLKSQENTLEEYKKRLNL